MADVNAIDVLIRDLALFSNVPTNVQKNLASRTIEFLLDPTKSADFQRFLSELSETQRLPP